MTHQKKVMNDDRSSTDRKEKVVNNIASVHLRSDMIYMSRRGLTEISEFVLNTTHVKSLYLEGNEITRLPEHLFSSLTSLVWLDLRNNELTNLPAGVGRHRVFKACEGETMFHSDVPAVEKLQLSDRSGFSLDLCGEGVDDADVRHFQELRHRMVQKERTDLEQPGTSEDDREDGPLVLPNIRTNALTRGICLETQRWSRTDEIRLAAMRELKEKQWILEERKRCVHNFILEFILGKTAGLLPDVE
ncbi:hypothetical protein E1301_Tti020455 [Triplophysa tibetana]|uniref:Leucine-rich repeat-containing protein 27 n=1 Tax=Triplophysa tibetana TaxID=1572043 RepID=A0A5A9PBH7_9TELE|nr:hypothetical protein E1301_Tti020455 [Triplophysa tibetana]